MDRIKKMPTFHMDSCKLVFFWVDFTYESMPSIPMMMGEGHPSTHFGWKKKITGLHILNNHVLFSVRVRFHLWFG